MAEDNNNTASNSSLNQVNNLALANKLRTNNDLSKDLSKAAQLYEAEANKGSAEAQYWLGVMYLDGIGVNQNNKQALWWVEMSSEQDYPKAQKLLKQISATEDPEC